MVDFDDVTPPFADYVLKSDRRGNVERFTSRPSGDGLHLEWDGLQAESWIRLTWNCDALMAMLETTSLHAVRQLRLDLPSISAPPDSIAWIALLTRGDDGFMTPLKRLWRASDLEKMPPATLLVDLHGLKPVGKIELGVHFQRPAGDIAMDAFRMTVLPASGIVLAHAVYDGFEVRIEGLARDVERLGMAVRMQLAFDGAVRDEGWARIAPPADTGTGHGQYAFSLSAYAYPEQVAEGVQVSLIETGETVEIAVVTGEDSDGEEGGRASGDAAIRVDDEIIGNIEEVDRTKVIGWALCKGRPDAPLDLVFEVDGQPLSVMRTGLLREDVSERYGGKGRYGFTLQLPYGIALAEKAYCELRPVTGRNAIKNSVFEIPPMGLVIPDRKPVGSAYVPGYLSSPLEPISLVVLNRNGGALLKELFDSALEHEPADLIEWIVVDHDSKDETRDVCEAATDRGQRVHLLARGSNFSFSNSCNHGVGHASHDIVVLANNDLIFHGPIVRRVRAALSDPEVGIVGARLFDHSDTASLGVRNLKVVQHLGVHFTPQALGPWIRAFDARLTPDAMERNDRVVETPVVTGAFLGMRAADYAAAGGLDEEYRYGLEDIALALTVRFRLGLKVICDNTLMIAHHRGYTREAETDTTVRRRNNNVLLNRSWGGTLRKAVKRDVLARPAFWSGSRPVVGFVVADAGDTTSAGEYYTALELGRALQRQRPVHLRFVTRKEWHNLREIDLLVVMVAGFDLHKAHSGSAFLRTVNWTRQWFDKWAQDETLASYDEVLASSHIAADYLGKVLDRPLPVMPIATDPEAMSAGRSRVEYECDYCITGNRVGTTREIEFNLDPGAIDGTGAIYGSGWEETALAPLARGPVPYSEIPDVYASSRIVIDDANIATKRFGSCNSRVFDAIAAGCLLVTNGGDGVRELFGDLVPVYRDREELTATLNYWLANERERLERVGKLRDIVRGEHTYDRRASQLLDLIDTGPVRSRIAIKCAAPHAEREHWGDHHFACALAAALRREGFTVRVDYRETWECGLSQSDDAVIVLRGLLPYKPKPHQLNYVWIISHPGAVTLDELEPYDRIFSASGPHVDMLGRLLGRDVELLPQCTDAGFVWNGEGPIADQPPVFVGNSRGIHRTAVRWSVEAGHEVSVYGRGWPQFLPPERLKGEYVPNAILPGMYRRARAVLCDHYDDMRRLGYVSNRAYDVLASGGLLVTDDVNGIGETLPRMGYSVYGSREDLDRILREDLSIDPDERLARARWVAENHTFDQRAATLAGALRDDMASADGRIDPSSRETA